MKEFAGQYILSHSGRPIPLGPDGLFDLDTVREWARRETDLLVI